MKKFMVMWGVLAIVSPVMATPVSFFDSFEYADGVGDAAYAANWSVVSGQNRYPIATRVYEVGVTDPGALNGTKVAYGAMPAPSGGYGISHSLGGAAEPTNANPLVVATDWHSMAAGSNRSLISFAMEVSQGDVHAPPLGSAPLATPIPVIAIGAGMGAPNFNYQFFNGQSWAALGNFPLWAGYKQWNWQHLTLTLTDLGDPETQTGKHVGIHMINNDGSVVNNAQVDLAMWPAAWAAGETFDTVSFRSFDGVSYNSCIDSTTVSGGEVIPEPATMALVGLGLMLISRGKKGK